MASARRRASPTSSISSSSRTPARASSTRPGETAVRKIDLGTMMVTTLNGVPGIGSGSGDGDGVAASSDGATLYLVDRANGLRSVNLSNNSSTLIADIVEDSACLRRRRSVMAGSLYLTCGVHRSEGDAGHAQFDDGHVRPATPRREAASRASRRRPPRGSASQPPDHRLDAAPFTRRTRRATSCGASPATSASCRCRNTSTWLATTTSSSGVKGAFNQPTGVAFACRRQVRRRYRQYRAARRDRLEHRDHRRRDRQGHLGAQRRRIRRRALISPFEHHRRTATRRLSGRSRSAEACDETIKIDVTNGIGVGVQQLSRFCGGAVVGRTILDSLRSPEQRRHDLEYIRATAAPPRSTPASPNTTSMAAMDGTLSSAVFGNPGFMATDGTNMFLMRR